MKVLSLILLLCLGTFLFASTPAEAGRPLGRCPKPSGAGVCAFTCTGGTYDPKCTSQGLLCCKNGCGGTNCVKPVI
ncbi:DNA-binding protein D-ETS-4 [Armadillidium vulgare]|nr:DNA-binding protein D-ETS-4 [Armadillidium vulgare]